MSLLNIISNSSIGEKFSTGGITTLIGLLMTFGILAILILFIVLVRFLINKLDKIPFDNFISKVKSLFKKNKKNENNNSDLNVVTEDKDLIDDDVKLAIEKAVREYVKNSADDGKPHNNIKIVDIKEVK